MALITVTGVSLGYEGKAIVSELDFEVNQGDYLCIVGENGSGKSTLTNVVQFMYQPEDGDILFDGLSVKEINIGWLRSQIGVVMQENYLFDSSIRDNIAVNRPNAKMDEVIQAAKLAGVSTVTLRKDARQGYIPFTVSEKGRMKFLGKQLIHYINNVI